MMEYGRIEGVNKPISRLVQGTLMMDKERMEWSYALMDSIFAEGCTAFDTAHVYGNGENERNFGRWIRERGVRDQVVLIGKGAHHNADRQRVTHYDIEADLNDSFARFGFDYIDIYLLHRDDPSSPVGPIVEVLNQYQAAGKIGIFGGSNWSVERLEAANEYAYAHNLKPFAVSSPNFSLAAQHEPPWANCISIAAEQGKVSREWYAEHKMPLFTWSSLAGGFFSGRFRRDNLDSFDGYFDKLAVSSYCREDNFQRLDRAEQMAQERGLTIPQIALAYVLSQPLDIYALVGCNTVEEFRANVAALNLKLTVEEIAWLEGTPEPA
jgi:aryl-alcohol dehydrogenase-like predicted oxidoreductase